MTKKNLKRPQLSFKASFPVNILVEFIVMQIVFWTALVIKLCVCLVLFSHSLVVHMVRLVCTFILDYDPNKYHIV